MKKKLIVANWKMKPTSREEAGKLFKQYCNISNPMAETIICPPFIWLIDGMEMCKDHGNVSLGAQDVFWDNPSGGGAFTGEISADMLLDAGVSYAIAGHSERRELIGEDNETVARKSKVAIRAGLKLILCVGEPWKIRKQGAEKAKDYVFRQIDSVVKSLTSEERKAIRIAYEPIWAISTSDEKREESPEDASEMINGIKEYLESEHGLKNTMVLYGGSVDRADASEFICAPGIDGVLVGSASLKPDDFSEILKTVCGV